MQCSGRTGPPDRGEQCQVEPVAQGLCPGQLHADRHGGAAAQAHGESEYQLWLV